MGQFDAGSTFIQNQNPKTGAGSGMKGRTEFALGSVFSASIVLHLKVIVNSLKHVATATSQKA